MKLAVITLLAIAGSASAADPQIHSALMDLYQSCGGAQWTNKSGWGSDDYCTFAGVRCELHTDKNLVTELKLPGNNLAGSLPMSMIKMKDLKVIDLSGNKIVGDLPSNFAAFSQVTNLDLSSNGLTGTLPATIMNVTYPYPTWREINLSKNKLKGTIPDTWFGPKNPSPFDPILGLQILNLEYNQLTGSIPTRLNNLHRLTTLLLDYNELSGSITDTVLSHWLGTRKYCSLGGNNFTCPIPQSVIDTCQAECHNASSAF